MPPTASTVNDEFRPSEDNFKTPMVECVHCGRNVIKSSLQRKKDHLERCKVYQGIRKQQVDLGGEGSDVKRRILPFSPQPVSIKAQRDRLLARAIYAGGLPFSLCDATRHPEWSEFIHAFDASWSPPSRARLAGQLLNEDFERVQDLVNHALEGEQRLNLTADESTAKNSDRVANIAINTAACGSFHLETASVRDRNVTAEEVFSIVTSHASRLTSGNLSRWNSICTDTCSTMRSLHSLIQKAVETSHVFTVLCDSHGLQLLLKDICSIQDSPHAVQYYGQTLAEATFLSSLLRRTKLSLAIIRRIAAEQELSFRAFATAAITRWGSHYAVVNALVESRNLLWYARSDSRLLKTLGGSYIRGGDRAMKLLYDGEFWRRLEHLHSLLRAINAAQIISESDRTTVGQVISRWDDLSEAIGDLNIPETDAICRLLDERLDKQTTAIHWAARALDPTNPSVSMEYTHEHEEMARAFMIRHTPADYVQSFNHQLANFRHQTATFARTRELWSYATDYVTFWDMASSEAPELSRLAVRLHETPANSVPSERSFSAMNFIQNDTRTRLTTDKTNKLTYIFMNTKALRRRPLLLRHHQERRRRRQAREREAANRKVQRQQELEIFLAEDTALGAVGAATKVEQLDDEEVDELYEQAIAALPDDDEEMEIAPATVPVYQQPWDTIDPQLLYDTTNKRLYSGRDSYTQ